jgi:hypothetical protein
MDNKLKQFYHDVKSNANLTHEQRQRIFTQTEKAEKANQGVNFALAVGENALNSALQYNRELEQNAENDFQIISRLFHNHERKQKTLVKIIKTNLVTDNEMLSAIKKAREELAAEKEERIKRDRLAEEERKRTMSLKNRLRELEKYFVADPETAYKILSKFPTQEIVTTLQDMEQKPNRYNQQLNDFRRFTKILEDELTKRENADPAKKEIRQRLRNFIS